MEIILQGNIDENGFLSTEKPLDYRNKKVKIILIIEDQLRDVSMKRSGFGTLKGIKMSDDFDSTPDDFKDYLPKPFL